MHIKYLGELILESSLKETNDATKNYPNDESNLGVTKDSNKLVKSKSQKYSTKYLLKNEKCHSSQGNEYEYLTTTNSS